MSVQPTVPILTPVASMQSQIGDNIGTWSAQYPELLAKNFIGLMRHWDNNNPHVTRDILPIRNMKFNFQWRVRIEPNVMSPYVNEGADTPMLSSGYKYESFVCQESRLGDKISERQLQYGIANAVQDITKTLTSSVNLTRTHNNILALLGQNSNQDLALTRLNTRVAGVSGGATTPKAWNESSAKILDDLIDAQEQVWKASDQRATKLLCPITEYFAMQRNSEIIDELKYTKGNLLIDGQILRIKGLDVIVVPTYYKERHANGEETKVRMLEDKVVVCGDNLGFTAVAEPGKGAAPLVDRWEEKAKRSLIVHAYSSFTSVIEDYAKIAVISGTNANVA